MNPSATSACDPHGAGKITGVACVGVRAIDARHKSAGYGIGYAVHPVATTTGAGYACTANTGAGHAVAAVGVDAKHAVAAAATMSPCTPVPFVLVPYTPMLLLLVPVPSTP